MKKWQCLVCGWIYDEAEGWPDDGIKPGTKWENIPEDWTCPDCGVGKEDFEMVEIKTVPLPTNELPKKPDPIIIIGSGLAAQNLIKELRKINKTVPIMMITREEGNLYYKPNLSAALSQAKTPDDLVLSRRRDIEVGQAIDIKSYTNVSAVNSDKNTISIGEGDLSYSQLVFATGASVIKPPFTGDAVDLILSVNSLDDYRRYRTSLVGASKVVIIGAGLIGCEFANDLLECGIGVEIIDAENQCMPRLLPKEAAKGLETGLRARGAKFNFNRKVEAVNKNGLGYKLSLDDGSIITADLVLSAMGLKSNTGLTKKTAIATSSAIDVNQFLETSVKDIYAVGDCASVEGHNLMFIEPLILSVKALAKTLMGEKTAVEIGTLPITVKTPICPVVVAPPNDNTQGNWTIEGDGTDIAAVHHDNAGKLTGFALTGDKVSLKTVLMKKI